MNKECDYSAAYIEINTTNGLKGQGMTFSESHLHHVSITRAVTWAYPPG
jgi:hypothetical protein